MKNRVANKKSKFKVIINRYDKNNVFITRIEHFIYNDSFPRALTLYLDAIISYKDKNDFCHIYLVNHSGVLYEYDTRKTYSK